MFSILSSLFNINLRKLMRNKTLSMRIHTTVNYNRKNLVAKWFVSFEHTGCASLGSVKWQHFKLLERNGEKNVNTLFIVNISLLVSHKLALLVKDYIKGKGKYLENFFQRGM